jgi:hypothetical protein
MQVWSRSAGGVGGVRPTNGRPQFTELLAAAPGSTPLGKALPGCQVHGLSGLADPIRRDGGSVRPMSLAT